MLSAFLALSEGRVLADAELDALVRTAPAFVDAARLGWVVVHLSRTPPALHEFVVRALALERVAEDGDAVLYRIGVGSLPPPAAAISR